MKKIASLCLLAFTVFQLQAQNTWSNNIAQIVYDNCTSCHNPNGIAPFSLLTFGDAKSASQSIMQQVNEGSMPPWIADTTYQRYAHERVLDQSEKNAINDWVLAGAPEGKASETPPPPVYTTTGFINKAPDLELEMPAYTSKASSSGDDYVCFSLPSGLAADKKIRAFEIIPGNHAIVHHALVYIDPNRQYTTDTSSGLCTGPVTGLIGGYVPGSPPTIFPSNGTDFNLGYVIPKNANVVIAMHYPEGSGGMVDGSKIRFWFYPDEVQIRSLGTHSLIENWSFVLPANRLTTVEDQFSSSAADLSILSVFPHMHLLGKSIESHAVTPTGDTIPFVRIPKWDFEWQEFLFFDKMKKLPKNSIIYGKGVYDNTSANPHNPKNPPVLVKPGLNTTDEMFLIYFHFLTYQEGDENRDIHALSNLATSNLEGFSNIEFKVGPNPSSSSFDFRLTNEYSHAKVGLRIYSAEGRLVQTISSAEAPTTKKMWTWKPGLDVGNGLYYYSLNVDGKLASGSLVISR